MNINKSAILFVLIFIFLITISNVSAEDSLVCADKNVVSDGGVISVENNVVSDSGVISVENNVVSEGNSFLDLQDDINHNEHILEITHDYKYNNASDSSISKNGILINKCNYVINGNNHTIDAKHSSKILNIAGSNITFNNFNFINVDSVEAIHIEGSNNIIFNNCAFTNVSVEGFHVINSTLILNNISHINNNSKNLVYTEYSNINLKNSKFINIKNSTICYGICSNISLANCVYDNLNLVLGHIVESLNCNVSIKDCKFSDISTKSSGGVVASKYSLNIYINNSEFNNCFSIKNGGAIFADYIKSIKILNSKFLDCYSNYGGAVLVLDSGFIINNSTFLNNKALYDGGAVYTSLTEMYVYNSLFKNNSCISSKDVDYSNGGALYVDKPELFAVNNSKFISNRADKGGAIFVYDADKINIYNSYFKNNKEAIYGVFTNKYSLKNNTWNKDSLSLNNTVYINVVETNSVKYKLLNNTLNTSNLPESFNLCDYGWVTPVRDQKNKAYCWAFGTAGALESAILKATGLEYDFSESNIGNLVLRYSKLGLLDYFEPGLFLGSSSYLLSWLGVINNTYDTYDEWGKISPILAQYNDFHVQNIIFIDENSSNKEIKQTLMKYGALGAYYYEDLRYYNPETAAFYCYNQSKPNHAVTLVGWDDNFSKYNFIKTPPGNGAWIIKNSHGTEFGDNGYIYISYYDTSFLKGFTAMGFIINDTIFYNKNYQLELFEEVKFKDKYTSYGNKFTATGDDLIAAIGTYFNSAGVKYTIKVYVNNKLKYTQKGVSDYYGYSTIPLNKYIKVNKGDSFFITVDSNSVPLSTISRVYLDKNCSFVKYNGKWIDLTTKNKFLPEYDCFLNPIASLKAYTLDCGDFIISAPNSNIKYNNEYLDISLTTSSGVPIINANIKVILKSKYHNYLFNIVTDDKGIAHLSLKNVPAGNYSVDFYFKYMDKNGNYKVCMNSTSLTVKVSNNKNINNISLIPMEHTGIPILVLLITLFGLVIMRKKE